MNKNRISKLKSILGQAFRPSILTLNYKLNRYQNTVWLIGSGRSGTTWVSNMINYKRQYRDLLEPFRPKLIKEAHFLRLHEYISPTENNEALNQFSYRVFSGKFQHKDADSAANKIIYKGLLVKDVFCNLLAYNVYKNKPNLKVVLLLRNPFIVAKSKLKKKDWIWLTDPKDFLDQPLLVRDHLYPFKNLILEISKTGDYIEKQILIWCIINYVPLKQFAPKELYVLFYEDMVKNTQQEVSKIWTFVNPNKNKQEVIIPEKVRTLPSSVSLDLGQKAKNVDSLENWKSNFTKKQLTTGYYILKQFGLEGLYQENGLPNHEVLAQFLKT